MRGAYRASMRGGSCRSRRPSPPTGQTPGLWRMDDIEMIYFNRRRTTSARNSLKQRKAKREERKARDQLIGTSKIVMPREAKYSWISPNSGAAPFIIDSGGGGGDVEWRLDARMRARYESRHNASTHVHTHTYITYTYTYTCVSTYPWRRSGRGPAPASPSPCRTWPPPPREAPGAPP